MSQYPLQVHQLAYRPCNGGPMGTHKGACPCYNNHFSLVCA